MGAFTLLDICILATVLLAPFALPHSASGKDFTRAETVTTAVLFEGSQMALFSADSQHNFSVLGFNPENPETSGGLWLTPTADINVGALVPSVLPLRVSNPIPPLTALPFCTYDIDTALPKPLPNSSGQQNCP